MAANPTFKKREKERARQERQREKAAKRKERKIEKQNRPAEDPCAGIVPGPQPATEDGG